jgi:sporulation protein YlmC with PRC-barrel domain
MSHLIVTALVLAVLVHGVVEAPEERQPGPASDLSDYAAGVTTVDVQAVREGYSVRRLLGTEVTGANGEKLGEVDDVIADAKGHVSTLVVRVGGLGEIADRETQIPWRHVRVEAHSRQVTAPRLPEQQVEQRVREKGNDEVMLRPGEWRVKQLLDDAVGLRDGGELREVEDVILSRNGKIEAWWCSPGPASAIALHSSRCPPNSTPGATSKSCLSIAGRSRSCGLSAIARLASPAPGSNTMSSNLTIETRAASCALRGCASMRPGYR